MSSPRLRRPSRVLALALLALFVNSAQTLAQQQSVTAAVAPTATAHDNGTNDDKNDRAADAKGATSAAPARASAAPAAVAADDDTDLEIHLQLVIGSNAGVAGAPVPASLDATLKQLRANMQLTNYRLGATFLHRVKNGRTLEVKATGGVLPAGVGQAAGSNPYIPSFYEFSMRPVELHTSTTGQAVVSIPNFHFGMRIPVLTAMPVGRDNAGPAPVVYEPTGISTGLSVAEGQPVVVGTLYTGPDNEAVVVLLTARRITPR